MVYPYSATVALAGKIASYAVLGLIGMVTLIKKRQSNYAALHTQQEGFITIENRARTVLCNPLIVLFLAYAIVMLVSSIHMAWRKTNQLLSEVNMPPLNGIDKGYTLNDAGRISFLHRLHVVGVIPEFYQKRKCTIDFIFLLF